MKTMSYHDVPPVFLTSKRFIKKSSSFSSSGRASLIKFACLNLTDLDLYNIFKSKNKHLRGVKSKVNIKISLCRRRVVKDQKK